MKVCEEEKKGSPHFFLFQSVWTAKQHFHQRRISIGALTQWKTPWIQLYLENHQITRNFKLGKKNEPFVSRKGSEVIWDEISVSDWIGSGLMDA
jgi:hypothetical protein